MSDALNQFRATYSDAEIKAEYDFWAARQVRVRPLLPRVLPPHWFSAGKADVTPGGAWFERADGLRLLATAHRERDERVWIHLSFSRRDRVPDYGDITDVKNLFVPAYKAIQVFPRADEHVNIHPYTLHLFVCVDGDPLPDFRRLGGI